MVADELGLGVEAEQGVELGAVRDEGFGVGSVEGGDGIGIVGLKEVCGNITLVMGREEICILSGNGDCVCCLRKRWN